MTFEKKEAANYYHKNTLNILQLRQSADAYQSNKVKMFGHQELDVKSMIKNVPQLYFLIGNKIWSRQLIYNMTGALVLVSKS